MTPLDGQEREALKRLLAVTELPGTRTEIEPEMERAKSFARAALTAREDTERPDNEALHRAIDVAHAHGWVADLEDADSNVAVMREILDAAKGAVPVPVTKYVTTRDWKPDFSAGQTLEDAMLVAIADGTLVVRDTEQEHER